MRPLFYQQRVRDLYQELLFTVELLAVALSRLETSSSIPFQQSDRGTICTSSGSPWKCPVILLQALRFYDWKKEKKSWIGSGKTIYEQKRLKKFRMEYVTAFHRAYTCMFMSSFKEVCFKVFCILFLKSICRKWFWVHNNPFPHYFFEEKFHLSQIWHMALNMTPNSR